MMKPPLKMVGETEFGGGGKTSLHWDLDGESLRKGPHANMLAANEEPALRELQGLVCLADATADGGGLRVIPGWHHRHRAWLEQLPPDRSLEQSEGGHWVHSHPDLAWMDDAALTVEAPAGSLIVWYPYLPHDSGPNHSRLPRLCQFVAMEPVSDHSGGDPAGEAYQERSGRHIALWRKEEGSRPEEEYLAEALEAEAPPAELTALGRKLIGLDPWPSAAAVTLCSR